jgi:hypothetical protein
MPTVVELKKEAKELGIKNFGTMLKAGLIASIKAAKPTKNIAHFRVADSTLSSLYEYDLNIVLPFKVGKIIRLISSKSGKVKIFKIEYLKKINGGYIVKNSNNTLFLKRI